MRVLVCGSREFHDHETLFRVMDKVASVVKVDAIIEGAAGGADQLAYEWARSRGVYFETYPAEWKRYGKAAGARRNRQMLVDGKPELVVAFPLAKSVGTRHMMRIAKEAGVTVWEMPRDESMVDALGEGVFV